MYVNIYKKLYPKKTCTNKLFVKKMCNKNCLYTNVFVQNNMYKKLYLCCLGTKQAEHFVASLACLHHFKGLKLKFKTSSNSIFKDTNIEQV